nr:HlyD family efflux transporter periplasmic adaptor subunit [Desulfovibrio sp. JC022]
MVNEPRNLVPYSMGCLMVADGGQLRMEALSDQPFVDRNVPAVQWFERVGKRIWNSDKGRIPHLVERTEMDERDAREWGEYCPAHIYWLPLSAQRGDMGALLFASDESFSENNQVLFNHFGETCAHALQLYKPRITFRKALTSLPRRPVFILSIIAFILLFVLQVRLSALAPVEVVPADPFVVAAPINGVVKEIVVRSSQSVGKDELLVLLDDTEPRNRFEVARKALKVAEEEYSSSRRGAFVNARSLELLAEQKALVEQRKAEAEYAEDILARTRLTADIPGVAVTPPPDRWEGRPVAVGEAIMSIADPGRVEVRIMLPVKDAVLLEPGNEVLVFLDSDPLNPLKGRVKYSDYMPESTPAGDYAHIVTAVFDETQDVPRIGLQGTAKVYGEHVSIAYYLFRRPLIALRQATGL